MSKKFFKSDEIVEEVKNETEEVVAEPVELEEEVKEEPKEEKKELNKAFSVAKTNGKWYVVCIEFDVETGKVGKMELLGNGHVERFVAIEEFKISVARNKIV